MDINKNDIINKLSYTTLVYGRINKKLKTHLSNNDCEILIKKVLKTTDEVNYKPKGKNIYVSNQELQIRVTINSNTIRVITVDKI